MPLQLDRRSLIAGAGALAGTSLAGPVHARNGRKFNVLMIVTDQEQGLQSWPKGMLEKLPGHQALLKRGLHVKNYHIQTTPCSPSRSTIFCGRHTQQTGVYLNADTPPNPVLTGSLPTLGNMMQAAGYYTSYKGKWHLSEINKDRNWNRVPGGIYPNTRDAMEKFGFHDYDFDGEAVGLTWDGYRSDEYVAAATSRSILDYGDKAGQDGRPWFMVCGLVNPHDIMFYDATGRQAESRPHRDLLAPVMREPGDPLYAVDNGFDMPESFYKDDLSTKPEAHRAIRRLSDAFYGKLPLDDHASWLRFRNYYYNCLRDVDRRLQQVLWALEKSGQMDNTIIIYTADHGERCGAHTLRQKGGTMYREEINVPMIIVHPDLPGGRETDRIMSAVDIAPTLASLAGFDQGEFRAKFPGLPGVDVSSMIVDAKARTERDVRGHLFNYEVGYMWEPLKVKPKVAPGTPFSMDQVYDLSYRRLHRGVFDGRWKFARYFAPAHHHTPRDWKMLDRLNDLELYDTWEDPKELTNLAYVHGQRKNVLRLSAMVNALIAKEIGVDDGSCFPGPTSIYNQPA
ncbi:MAG: sulfatase-like hydrolase/transferase [Sphingomonadales bacterium]|nr:sulfatase-like hydrolase/transferase [Sphingomonadales bacterium]MDE2569724.1 sulfatase-like hydrolase/transferase [Sphingomonadales bacterium]